jgi:hypothetical protein
MTTDIKIEAKVIVQGLMIQAMATKPARPTEPLRELFNERMQACLSDLARFEQNKALIGEMHNAAMELMRPLPPGL